MLIRNFKRNSLILSVAVLGVLSFFIATNVAAVFQGPLRVSPTNPRYFTDDSGKAIYMTGSHTWNALIDQGSTDPPIPFDFAAYLSFLQQHHHNFLRFWAWTAPYVREGATSPYDFSTPQPWLRTGPGTAWDGKPKFDLSSFDEGYFSRLRQRVIDAGNSGMYANINLFEGWWFASQKAGRSNDGWSSHPFRSINNINGINTDTNGDGYGYEFYTLNAPPAVIDLQKAYVSKLLDSVNDLDNVLYEIVSQAASDSAPWQYMIINFVKQEMAARGKTHPVGMSDLYLQASSTALFNSPADWISPGSSGGYSTNPPVVNGAKVILIDSDHFWGFDQNGDHSSWVWKGFTHGMSVIYMDDPSITTVSLEKNRKAMGDTLRYAEKMDLDSMLPSTTLCSTAYCLTNPGKEYLVFQASSGGFNLTVAAGRYTYEWFNPNTHAVVQTGTMTLAGGSRSFTPPFSGAAVLYLTNVPDTTLPSTPMNLTAAVITSSQVNLTWTASTDNVGIAGYKIYRDGVQIATTTATSYTNGGLTQLTTYTYQVSAFDAAGNNSPLSSPLPVTTLGLYIIPKTNWVLKFVDSQETTCENGAGVNAFDNNNATFWHTRWCGGNPPPPHEIQIDMGGSYNINGLRYLPRQDGEVNGTIGRYEFYISTDGVTWGSAVATGTFANTTAEKEVGFTAKTGRYVRLRALTEVNGNPWTSVAEINVLGLQ